jgi:hypothetical protein
MFEAVSVDLLKTHIAEFKARANRVLIFSNYYNTSLEQKDWLLNIQPDGFFFLALIC